MAVYKIINHEGYNYYWEYLDKYGYDLRIRTLYPSKKIDSIRFHYAKPSNRTGDDSWSEHGRMGNLNITKLPNDIFDINQGILVNLSRNGNTEIFVKFRAHDTDDDVADKEIIFKSDNLELINGNIRSTDYFDSSYHLLTYVYIDSRVKGDKYNILGDFSIENGELEVRGTGFDTRDRHVDKWRKKKSDLESTVRSIEYNKNNKISEKNRLYQRITELIRTNNTKALERDTAIKNQKAINDDLVIKKNELLGNKKRLQDKLEFFRTGIGGDEYIQLIKDFIAASPGYLNEIKEMVNRVKTRNNNIKESDKIPVNELHTTTFGKINVIDVKSFNSNNKFLDLYDNFHADYLCKHEHAGVYIIKNVSLSKLYDYGLSDMTGDIKKKTKRIYGLTHKNDNINEILEYANSTKTGNSREGVRQIDNTDVSKLFVSDPLNAEMDLLLYPYMKWKNNNQDDPYNLLEYNDPTNFNKEEITCILIVEGDKRLQTVTQTIIIYPLLITAVRTLNLKSIDYNDDLDYEFDPEDLNIRYNPKIFRLTWRTYNGFNKTWREWNNLNLPWKRWERYTGNEIPNT